MPGEELKSACQFVKDYGTDGAAVALKLLCQSSIACRQQLQAAMNPEGIVVPEKDCVEFTDMAASLHEALEEISKICNPKPVTTVQPSPAR